MLPLLLVTATASLPPPIRPSPLQGALPEALADAVEACPRGSATAVSVLAHVSPAGAAFVEASVPEAHANRFERCVVQAVKRALAPSFADAKVPDSAEAGRLLVPFELPPVRKTLRVWRNALRGKRGAERRLERMLPAILHRPDQNCVYLHAVFSPIAADGTELDEPFHDWVKDVARETKALTLRYRDLEIEISDVCVPSGPGFSVHRHGLCVRLTGAKEPIEEDEHHLIHEQKKVLRIIEQTAVPEPGVGIQIMVENKTDRRQTLFELFCTEERYRDDSIPLRAHERRMIYVPGLISNVTQPGPCSL